MSLLQEATINEQGAAKMAWYGPQGSGKTTAATLVAAGLSLTYHKGAPIAFFDTEKGSDFAKNLLDVEGVKMLRVKSRAFSDLLQSVKEAEQAGCCAFIVDSMSHVWSELMDAFCRAKKIKRIEFQHWRELKASWGEWTDSMLNSPLHMLLCGRAGKVYEYEENENGKKELVTTGTKFKAEGEFGYEPDLLVELWLEREDGKKKGSHLIHKGIVLKDRSAHVNGHEFSWKDKSYKKGDYRLVFNCFDAYFKSLTIGQHSAAISSATSDRMFDSNGDGSYVRQQKLRQAGIEDWDATMDLMFPGSTAAMKRNRAIVGEAITGVRSRTKFEQFDVKQIQECVGTLMALEHRLKSEPVATESDLLSMVEIAKEDWRTVPQDVTLLELLAKKSVAAVQEQKEQEAAAVPF